MNADILVLHRNVQTANSLSFRIGSSNLYVTLGLFDFSYLWLIEETSLKNLIHCLSLEVTRSTFCGFSQHTMPVGFSKVHKVNGYSLYIKKQKQKIKKEKKKKDGSDG